MQEPVEDGRRQDGVIPGVTGAGALVKALTHGDDAVDAVKAVDRVGDVVDAVRAAETSTDVITTGARQILDDYDFEAAEKAYDVIRNQIDDVAKIANNTGISESRVNRVKNHLFYNSHQLDDAVRRFDADPEIANSWNRLTEGAHSQADIDLINHELFESRFEGIFKTDYRTAYKAANRAGHWSGLE